MEGEVGEGRAEGFEVDETFGGVDGAGVVGDAAAAGEEEGAIGGGVGVGVGAVGGADESAVRADVEESDISLGVEEGPVEGVVDADAF